MADTPKPRFASFAVPSKGVLVVFAEPGLKFGPATRKALEPVADLVERAAQADRFTAKSSSGLDILAPPGLGVDRLIVLGLGKTEDLKPYDYLRLGGIAVGRMPSNTTQATIFAESASGPMTPEQAAEVALGSQLRSYTFERYKTKKKDGEEQRTKVAVTVGVASAQQAEKAWQRRRSIGEGVTIARDLVNEPPNVLFPEEFARRATALKKLGVTVEVLDVKAMKKLGMNALLGVGQGSAHESRTVIMRWNGGKRGAPPVAFIGKGVTFDTGGISIKPAAGMEDMKGDMAGAACVVGLMHALAARKAKVNVVGAVGIVQNMPDGNAQRPGDIVTSMSGQTIEIINTDAEGRLVLGDVLHHVNQTFEPKFMINLATLTGAIIVALGVEHAGLFSNDDKLSEQLTKVGLETGEKVWRMPIGPEYDKLIDSRFADMKNTGGRNAGSITAAQFLHRFVGKTPWAHLDIAGTAMSSPNSDINRSWGSGWGVRLLDQLVTDYYEK
jgi:leucyl aminopeptidase